MMNAVKRRHPSDPDEQSVKNHLCPGNRQDFTRIRKHAGFHLIHVRSIPCMDGTSSGLDRFCGRHHDVDGATLPGMGAAYTVQHGLIQFSGHSLVQAATDAASKLDMMILERHRDIQLLASTPMAQSQNPAALTAYLGELESAHPAYRWIGVTDSHGKVIAATDTCPLTPSIGARVGGSNWHAPSVAPEFSMPR